MAILKTNRREVNDLVRDMEMRDIKARFMLVIIANMK